MGLFSGSGGFVRVGSTTVGNLSSWQVAPRGNTALTTAFNSAYETRSATTRQWSAQFAGYLDSSDTGQATLSTQWGSALSFTFVAGDAQTNWAGTGILTGVEIKTDAAGGETIACSINGSGPLTFGSGMTASLSQVAASTSTRLLLAANATRGGLTLYNNSAATLYLAYGPTASQALYTTQVGPAGWFEMPQAIYTGALSAVWDSATGLAEITEF